VYGSATRSMHTHDKEMGGRAEAHFRQTKRYYSPRLMISVWDKQPTECQSAESGVDDGKGVRVSRKRRLRNADLIRSSNTWDRKKAATGDRRGKERTNCHHGRADHDRERPQYSES